MRVQRAACLLPLFLSLSLSSPVYADPGHSGQPPTPALITVDFQRAGARDVEKSVFGLSCDPFAFQAGWTLHGDLLADRGFRTLDPTMAQTDAWSINSGPETTTAYVANATAPADLSVPNGETYAGHLMIDRRNATDVVRVEQPLLAPVVAGQELSVFWSVAALRNAFTTGAPALGTIVVSIVDGSQVLAQQGSALSMGSAPLTNSSWLRQAIKIAGISKYSSSAKFVVEIAGAAGTVHIDEVRLIQGNASLGRLVPNPAIVRELRAAGVANLRYPGGQAVDGFRWKQTVGPVLARGEMWTGSTFATARLGLVEFLGLCDALGAEPVVQVNVREDAGSAADLWSFLDAAKSSGGGGGGGGGRGVSLFLFGNAPGLVYSASGNNQSVAYAKMAASAATAIMEASQNATGVHFGFTGEPNHVLTAYGFEKAYTRPQYDFAYDWNADVWGDPSSPVNAFIDSYGVAGRTFVSGHYHCPEGSDPQSYFTDFQDMYWQLSSSCGLLATRANSQLYSDLNLTSTRPSLRFIASEYSAFFSRDAANTFVPEYSRDGQAGFVVANQLFEFIKSGMPYAHLQDALSQDVYGILKRPPYATSADTFVHRPRFVRSFCFVWFVFVFLLLVFLHTSHTHFA
jgi:hypothetical protein